MAKKFICNKCNNIFDEAALGNAKLNNGSIEVQCAKCDQPIKIIEKAVCDWPFFIEGPFDVGATCTNIPIYILPYKTFDGIKYRCVCHEHIVTNHIIPFRYIGPKKITTIIHNEIEKRYPIKLSFFRASLIFGVLFGPILILYAFLATVFPRFATTQFSVIVILFGVAWHIAKKIGFIRIPFSSNLKLRRIWLFVFISTLLVETIVHYLS